MSTSVLTFPKRHNPFGLIFVNPHPNRWCGSSPDKRHHPSWLLSDSCAWCGLGAPKWYCMHGSLQPDPIDGTCPACRVGVNEICVEMLEQYLEERVVGLRSRIGELSRKLDESEMVWNLFTAAKAVSSLRAARSRTPVADAPDTPPCVPSQ